MKKETLSNMIEQFINEEINDEKSNNTVKHYEHVFKMFVDFLHNEEVTKKDVIDFKQKMQINMKPKTVNNYIVVINKFLKYAAIVDKGYPSRIARTGEYTKLATMGEIEDLTVKNIKMQNRSSLEEVLEPIDLKRLMRWAKKLERMDMYLIMKIIAFTGVRAEELKVFTVENIQSNYIETKNKGKIRNVILRQDLRRELIKYCKNNNIASGYIFKGKKEGTMIHSTTIYKQLKKIAGFAKVKKSKVHAHSFRHLFAIKFIEEGGDISELADILGHSSIETTRIYTMTTDSMKRKRMERMKY